MVTASSIYINLHLYQGKSQLILKFYDGYVNPTTYSTKSNFNVNVAEKASCKTTQAGMALGGTFTAMLTVKSLD